MVAQNDIDIRTLYEGARAQLAAEPGIDTPALDARILLRHVFPQLEDSDFITGRTLSLSANESQLIHSFIHRRIQGEPVSRILGQRAFWTLDLSVTPDVLDPRADTETLVQAALEHARAAGRLPARILDLGTGSGCILLALLSEFPKATGVGVDISEAALSVAQDNAKRNNLADRACFQQGVWAEGIEERFDLVVSNPPYIPRADIESLAVDVKNHDPILALDGGEDGLDCYKIIFSQLKNVLKEDGRCLFEIGISQEEDLARIAGNYGFHVSATFPDLAGILRVVEISFGENIKKDCMTS